MRSNRIWLKDERPVLGETYMLGRYDVAEAFRNDSKLAFVAAIFTNDNIPLINYIPWRNSIRFGEEDASLFGFE